MKHTQENELIFEVYKKRNTLPKAERAAREEMDRRDEEAKEWLRKNTVQSRTETGGMMYTPIKQSSTTTPTSTPKTNTPLNKTLQVGDIVTLKRDVNSFLPDDHNLHPLDQLRHEKRNTGKIVEVKYRVDTGGGSEWYSADQLFGPFENDSDLGDYVPDHPDMEHL